MCGVQGQLGTASAPRLLLLLLLLAQVLVTARERAALKSRRDTRPCDAACFASRWRMAQPKPLTAPCTTRWAARHCPAEDSACAYQALPATQLLDMSRLRVGPDPSYRGASRLGIRGVAHASGWPNGWLKEEWARGQGAVTWATAVGQPLCSAGGWLLPQLRIR